MNYNTLKNTKRMLALLFNILKQSLLKMFGHGLDMILHV